MCLLLQQPNERKVHANPRNEIKQKRKTLKKGVAFGLFRVSGAGGGCVCVCQIKKGANINEKKFGVKKKKDKKRGLGFGAELG